MCGVLCIPEGQSQLGCGAGHREDHVSELARRVYPDAERWWGEGRPAVQGALVKSAVLLETSRLPNLRRACTARWKRPDGSV